MDEWISKAIGKMHVNKITNIQLSQKLGVTKEYVSMIFNGKKQPKDAEQRIMSAINEIISERN